MRISIRQRVGSLGPVQKVLLGGGTIAAAALLTTGVASAATSAGATKVPTGHSQPVAADTDNVQSGDQTGKDTATDITTAGDKADGPSVADTDNVQSGDQTGADGEVSAR